MKTFLVISCDRRKTPQVLSVGAGGRGVCECDMVMQEELVKFCLDFLNMF